MPEVFGMDWAEDFAEDFDGDLLDGTFTRKVTGEIDVNDPSGPPAEVSTTYACKGLAFKFAEDFQQGSSASRADYQVAILLGTINAIADDAVAAELDLATVAAHADLVLQAAAAYDGSAGNRITVELVGDAPTGAGTLVEVGTNARIGYLPNVSTTDDIADLLVASTLLAVADPGAGAVLLDDDDAIAATALAGGTDATQTQAPGVVPKPGDLMTFALPDSDEQINAPITEIIALTYAQATVRVRGPSA